MAPGQTPSPLNSTALWLEFGAYGDRKGQAGQEEGETLTRQQSGSAMSGLPRLTPHLRQERCFQGQAMVPILILIT